MPAEVFVDAGAWLALADRGDHHHQAAASVYPGLLRHYQRLVTTNLVVAEVYVLLRRELGHKPAIAFLENLGISSRIEKVFSNRKLETEAEAMLRRYEEHAFSFTDAVSFALMHERVIAEAFAFDVHFATAGFRRLP